MTNYDFNDAETQRNFDVIPNGTIATVRMTVRPGSAGEGGWLRRSKDGGCEMLVSELTIADGPYKGRKLFERWILAGTTDGHAKSADINRSTLKAILDSALGLKPDDLSPQARAARTVSLKQFEGMSFIGRIGIEKGRPRNDGSGENWPDKNILVGEITPDKRDWHPVEQPPPFNGGGGGAQAAPAGTASPIARPGWAS